MKNILIWLHSKFSAKESHDYGEVFKAIEEHEKETEHAAKVLDKAIAALDGETGWWSCTCKPTEKECKYADHNHSVT